MRNVILLTLDATRKDVFDVYGSTKHLTPTFDEFAAQSLVFTNAHSTGPYTRAAFPGILTSSHFLEYGPPAAAMSRRTLVSEPLHDAGIATAAFHSNPYLCDYAGWNRGWDRFYDSMDDEIDSYAPYVRGDTVNRKAFKWLRSHTKVHPTTPFFLWIHYMDVHEPYVPERRFVGSVDPGLDVSEEEMFALYENVLTPRDVSNPGNVAMLRRLYDVHVREIDTYFAELLGFLEDLNILSATTVIVTSDHGDEFAEHGGLSHDDKMYSELVDVPLLVHSTEEHGVCDKVVSSIDISPTIVNLFGLPAVEAFAGHSLLPCSAYAERAACGEAIRNHAEEGTGIEGDIYFLREGNWKAIHRPETGSWELYDLASDPGELADVSDTSDRAEPMKAKLLSRVGRWNRPRRPADTSAPGACHSVPGDPGLGPNAQSADRRHQGGMR